MILDPAREVAPGVLLVDTGHERPRLAASYLLRGAGSAAVVETGTARSAPRILAAIDAAGIPRPSVSWVIVTHVHLDHAGGAGALLRELPEARLLVHPRGARHLVDPAKLVAGTVEVYGPERAEALFGTMVPVAPERVVESSDGMALEVGGRALRLLDTPGHARHHFVLLDEATRGFFTGDTFGISYPETDVSGRRYLFPTTTPVHFEPEALHASIDRMMAEGPRRMYLTHYGLLEGALERCAEALHRSIDGHVRRARAAPGGPGRGAALRSALREQLLEEIAAHGLRRSREEIRAIVDGDVELNAQGLEVWLDGRAGGS
jgi:glyoxylase-like metal-dependent hydrolase (beta-lactamase superfamily II)